MQDHLINRSVNGPSYYCNFMDPRVSMELLDQFATQVKQVIRENKWEIDAVVCRGVSGMLVAPYLAAKLKLALIVVRKNEQRHSARDVEGGWNDKFNYIIVDDLVDSGTTVKEILVKMKSDRERAECKGLFLYSNAQGCGKDDMVERTGVQNVFFWYNAAVGSTFDTTMPPKISKKSVDYLEMSDKV